MARSRTIAFRLHPGHPDEKRALAILDGLRREGYMTRYILMAGLLSLAGKDIPPPGEERSHYAELRAIVDELRAHRDAVRRGGDGLAIGAAPQEHHQAGRVSRALLDYLASEVIQTDGEPGEA
ncbi:MAG: hypothetical protein KBH93_00415 [Anaerolineae bacterium]|nr:hypothetical protein [Anaerolineae bacterium]